MIKAIMAVDYDGGVSKKGSMLWPRYMKPGSQFIRILDTPHFLRTVLDSTANLQASPEAAVDRAASAWWIIDLDRSEGTLRCM